MNPLYMVIKRIMELVLNWCFLSHVCICLYHFVNVVIYWCWCWLIMRVYIKGHNVNNYSVCLQQRKATFLSLSKATNVTWLIDPILALTLGRSESDALNIVWPSHAWMPAATRDSKNATQHLVQMERAWQPQLSLIAHKHPTSTLALAMS